jgi:heme-degrading monooxygenase HmoA
MQKSLLISLVLLSFLIIFSSFRKSPILYELRIYHCEPGKLHDLEQRFKNHTMALFEKHGMTNIAYWKPTKENNNSLYYILAYKDKESRDESWKNFIADPVWKEVQTKSEENGKILTKIESIFMTINEDLSKPSKKLSKLLSSNQTYEMRTYYLLPGRYKNIVARFKDHTRKILKSHGMGNIVYFDTIEKDGAQPKLLYFLEHKDEEAAKQSWDAFRADPKWIKARDASEVSGKIVEKVESVYLTKADFFFPKK